jgi:S1-C subfamily serine protease
MVTTVERQPLRLPDAELADWGMTARNLSFLSATELKLEQTHGVLVTSVRPAGPAGRSKPSLREGDVIRELAGHAVASLEELQELSDTLTRDKADPVAVLVRFARTPEDLVTVVEIGHKPKEKPAADARKAWVPVALQVITSEMASQFGDASMTGLRISQVYPGTSAEKAGLKVGDLIVALDGGAIEGREPGDESAFAEKVRQYAVGSIARLGIVRGGEHLEVAVELERSPKLDRELKRYENEQFEFTARDIGFFDRVHEGWFLTRTGALVTEVGNGGWAALGSLYVGDLVTAVDGTPIDDVAALEAKMKTIAADKPPDVVLQVLRGIHTYYVQLQTAWNHG